MGGFHTVERVFDDEAFRGGEVYSPDRFEVEIGCGFDFWSIAFADCGLKKGGQAKVIEPSVDPIVIGAGDDGAGNFLPSEMFQSSAESGNGFKFGDLFSNNDIASGIDGLPVEGLSREGFEVGFGRPSIEVGADALDVGFESELLFVLEKEVAPGFVDGPLGVENDAVEIKKNGVGIDRCRHELVRFVTAVGARAGPFDLTGVIGFLFPNRDAGFDLVDEIAVGLEGGCAVGGRGESNDREVADG